MKKRFTLYEGKFGYSITDVATGITYSERNKSEVEMFRKLYKEHFSVVNKK